jgi:hypothetical protein
LELNAVHRHDTAPLNDMAFSIRRPFA